MLDGEAFGLGTERSTFAAQRLRLLSRELRTSHSLSWVVPSLSNPRTTNSLQRLRAL